MILCDAGPLYALIDPSQAPVHRRCRDVLPSLSTPLVTGWPSFTEAMYLCHRSGGWMMQELLWDFVREGVLVLHDLGPIDVLRTAILMEEYRDTPMDLADAALVAIAEGLGLSRIFTLDHHFRVYRLRHREAFEIVP